MTAVRFISFVIHIAVYDGIEGGMGAKLSLRLFVIQGKVYNI
jgi:hypothetical protein